MRHRPRCRSREVTRRPHDAASPPLLVTGSDEEAVRCGIAALLVTQSDEEGPRCGIARAAGHAK